MPAKPNDLMVSCCPCLIAMGIPPSYDLGTTARTRSRCPGMPQVFWLDWRLGLQHVLANFQPTRSNPSKPPWLHLVSERAVDCDVEVVDSRVPQECSPCCLRNFPALPPAANDEATSFFLFSCTAPYCFMQLGFFWRWKRFKHVWMQFGAPFSSILRRPSTSCGLHARRYRRLASCGRPPRSSAGIS